MFRVIDSLLEDTVEDAISRGERAGYLSTMAAVERTQPVSLQAYLLDRLYTEFMIVKSWIGCRSRR